MKPKRSTSYIRSIVPVSLAMILLSVAAAAITEKTLVTFTGTNGAGPYGGLTFDSKGNLYGTAWNGGKHGTGLVFKLSKNTKGVWKRTTIHQFGPQPGSDGADPTPAHLAIDSLGNIYGTTLGGGSTGHGIVFRLELETSGAYKETILHSFTGGTDGSTPYGSVTLDSKGNLYGTTFGGGENSDCPSGCGTVFELTPTETGPWKETILHAFTATNDDGDAPAFNTLVFDSEGNLYGTTPNGGWQGFGIVYELSPATGGTYTYQVIHVFNLPGAADGGYPQGGVVLDSEGNLYGGEGGGWIYELVKANSYDATILYEGDQGGLYNTVTFDTKGNLYWATQSGGETQGKKGTVNELTPDGSGGWTFTNLYEFPADPATQGDQPQAPVTLDTSGNIYGACTTGGGSQGTEQGTIFEITP